MNFRKRIIWQLISVVLLAVISLLLNIQTPEMLETQLAQPLHVLQMALAFIANGAPWAIILITAGMAVPKWWQACLFSVFSGEFALAFYYALGNLIGFFNNGIGDNSNWFIFTILAGIFLGLLGYFAQKTNWVGHLLKLSIPIGLILEPFYLGRFHPLTAYRPVEIKANILAAWLELGLGILLLATFLWGIMVQSKSKEKFINY